MYPNIEEKLDGEREVDRPLHPGSAQFRPGGLTLASTVSSGPFPTPVTVIGNGAPYLGITLYQARGG